MALRTIEDFDFSGKRVLLRADLDVPLDDDGNITDDKRLEIAVPTIKALLKKGAKQIVIMGHLHRPGGRIVDGLRMNQVGKRLTELLCEEVIKLDDCIDVEIPDNPLVLLENLRFHADEKENYEFFAKKLAANSDIFVMDAFANSHRAHASMIGVMEFLPSCFGPNMIREYEMLSSIDNPEHPYTAIIGGKKISTKIGVINNLIQKVDYLIIGGAMIFTFFKAKGFEIGKSLIEEEHVELAKLLMHNEKLILPSDIIVSPSIDNSSDNNNNNNRSMIVEANEIPPDMFGLDIGPKSIEHFCDILKF